MSCGFVEFACVNETKTAKKARLMTKSSVYLIMKVILLIISFMLQALQHKKLLSPKYFLYKAKIAAPLLSTQVNQFSICRFFLQTYCYSFDAITED